ncbi:SpoIIE family protein phosphatase [Streptomyces sp. NPDC059698]|uniref:SpoIIE family protein phosphatase n=1 Tax=unclassified Streptomyces TaxID=2593676 RepID=UPI00093F7E66|nr:SpoIIE family protein phosphatase [Streptomyces sp. CB02366]OKJ28194.1 diguanylate cyclase [Streptomyces sp. CB02366]TVP36314.1 diguanylate cyclase [Streptomyces griseus subsp. griseus]
MNEERLLKRYQALMSAVPQSVWVMSPDGVITLLAGGGIAEKLWHPENGNPWMDAVHPKDRGWFQRAWRVATRRRIPLDTIVRVRLDGAPDRFRHVKIIAAPVLDQSGEVEWVGTATDAEDHWRTRMREKLLARMAAVPAAHDLSEAFLTTAAAVVPELADAVAVFRVQNGLEAGVRPSDGAPAVTSPERVGLAPGLPPLPPLEPGFLLGPVARQAIERQQARLLVFPPDGPPGHGLSAPAVRWLREAGATGVALLPVVVDGRTVALATIATCRGNPPPDQADLSLLQDVFQQMSGPLRRTMELQSIRGKALALQQSFLAPPPSVDGLTVTALYHPADSAAEVGGDWYDAVRLSPDALALSIGDIAGHDLDAATAMGRVNSILRGLAYDSGPAASPADTLSRLDRVVQALDSPSMVTAVHAVLRRQAHGDWHIAFSNAGHPPPLLLPADAPSRYLHGLTAPDPPLCVAEALPRTTLQAILRAGETLVLYTDGLVETPDTDIGDNLRRLRERTDALARRGLPLPDLIRGLLPPVQKRRDDIAVIALQARPDP